ncbi:hypothetical protein Tco_1376177 [Tanacetum coccineum]
MVDQDTSPPTITAMKIPIIKKQEYDIWSMRIRQYICHTDHNLWDIIVNGDLEDEATPSGEQSRPPVLKTAKQLAARRNQERIKSILLLAIPNEYLLKFHNVPDAKSLFQKLISQLEIHGAYVSKEDINQKFLRSLPPSWSQIALIMRNKLDIDEIDIDDLYNNLRNTNSTNKVSTASGDFRMDGDDLEELDLRWKVAMLTVRVKKLSATTVTKEDILLKNVDLEGVKEEDLMVTMAGAMHKQLNLHLRHCSSSSSDSEVQKYSKCLKSFKCLQKNYDTEREKHNIAKLEIRGYEIALESLESRILRHEKNELAWDERYEFQNYDLKCTTNEPTIVKPKSVIETVMSKSKINRDEVIIEDWTSDDKDDVCAVKTVSSVKPNVTQAVRSQDDRSGQTSQKQGIGFKKVHKIKACFVCKITGHLIKDYDFYDQKSPEPRVKNVVNTGDRVVKPV